MANGYALRVEGDVSFVPEDWAKGKTDPYLLLRDVKIISGETVIKKVGRTEVPISPEMYSDLQKQRDAGQGAHPRLVVKGSLEFVVENDKLPQQPELFDPTVSPASATPPSS